MQIDQWDFPDELYYNEGHAWARVEGDIVTVGVNDFTQFLAGEISYIDLPMEGDEFEFGERIGTIETGKWLGKYFAPVSGEIVEVNEKLEDDPTLINKSPYGEGWIVKIKMANPDELDKLMKDPEEIKKFIYSEVDRVANK
ncbi:glycine cleavage system protein GcvH [bacterium]|nr:MAG: glycine cleavage system protein GcvH [bacterium]